MDIWTTVVTLAGVLATPVLMVSYLPQIIGFYKSKKAEDVSLSFWFLLDTALSMLFILAVDGFLNGSGSGLLIAQAINLGLALVVTGQVIFYQRKGGR